MAKLNTKTQSEVQVSNVVESKVPTIASDAAFDKIAKIASMIETAGKTLREAAESRNGAHFDRKEMPKDLRSIELMVAHLRLAYKAAKMEVRLGELS